MGERGFADPRAVFPGADAGGHALSLRCAPVPKFRQSRRLPTDKNKNGTGGWTLYASARFVSITSQRAEIASIPDRRFRARAPVGEVTLISVR